MTEFFKGLRNEKKKKKHKKRKWKKGEKIINHKGKKSSTSIAFHLAWNRTQLGVCLSDF